MKRSDIQISKNRKTIVVKAKVKVIKRRLPPVNNYNYELYES
jgi:hypothetical protein